jgi:hypothetical protein
MGMFSAIAIWGLLAAAPTADVQVQLLRGETLTGELTNISAEKITIASSGKPQTIPAPEVLAVEFPASLRDEEPARLWLDLLDGSQVKAAGLTLSAGKATIELVGGERLEGISSRAIRAVRFRPAEDNALSAAWSEILAGSRSGDVLVLRKTATREVEEGGETKTITTISLDELEGTILAIGPDSVKFDFDGDKVDVKREKLEGVVLFQPVKRELPAATLRMLDVTGGEWRLRTIELKDEQLVGLTPAGVSVVLPTARVQRLDFSAGNVAMLATLPMESSEAAGALLPKSLSPAAAVWFGPLAGQRPGSSSNDPALKSAGKLSLTGKSQVTYRTPEGFRWFRSAVTLAGKQGTGSDVDVVVLGDGKQLAKQSLSAAGERQPVLLEVDVSGVRRLTLQSVPHGGQGFGALVDFQDARFTK